VNDVANARVTEVKLLRERSQRSAIAGVYELGIRASDPEQRDVVVFCSATATGALAQYPRPRGEVGLPPIDQGAFACESFVKRRQEGSSCCDDLTERRVVKQ
jgi:hypothetical protein